MVGEILKHANFREEKNSININFSVRISRGHSWPLRPDALGSKSFSPSPGPQKNALFPADVHDFRRGRPWPEGFSKNFVQKKFALIFWPLLFIPPNIGCGGYPAPAPTWRVSGLGQWSYCGQANLVSNFWPKASQPQTIQIFCCEIMGFTRKLCLMKSFFPESSHGLKIHPERRTKVNSQGVSCSNVVSGWARPKLQERRLSPQLCEHGLSRQEKTHLLKFRLTSNPSSRSHHWVTCMIDNKHSVLTKVGFL